jgi:N-acylneuraminate cytidylyltransferase
LLCVDVDGVLTDAGMYYSPDGEVLKKFNTRDGMGPAGFGDHRVQSSRGKIRRSCTRAAKLRIDDVFVAVASKRVVIDKLCVTKNLALDELAFIGDDLNDLEAPESGPGVRGRRCRRAVKAVAHYVALRRGGGGGPRSLRVSHRRPAVK